MEITAENITDYLLKINAKKSTGPDGSSPMILKLSSPAIASPLANLFNHPFPKKGEARDKIITNLSVSSLQSTSFPKK